ncbi:hypothetical protein [Emticicia sp. C21]|uniref:hypothetical protein n=1 Tax=Emticicia sp. C21 TaxID=2302915 RepID=UPI000E34AE24|nr:hypothetical protein [Emticicia sp. C21]RFS14883.1 hypothetical protein D0T08_19725 [Emticicia sp. C21]
MDDKLIFGIYPGGLDALQKGLPNNPEKINEALDILQGDKQLFLVRGYRGFDNVDVEAPEMMEQYCINGRKLDLTLCYRSATGDIDGWIIFIKRMIHQYSTHLHKIQITEEPNNPDALTGGDGSSKNIHEAIIEGVIVAKREASLLGLHIMVGFNAVVSFNPTDSFWQSLAERITPKFMNSLDFVGLDFFPDVFIPLPAKPDGITISIEEAVNLVLNQFRKANLAIGKISDNIPIHITENGWATTPERTFQRQKEVLIDTLLVVNQLKVELNITHYEYFGLRDADSSDNGFQFGLMKDDYISKPAFDAYKTLIKSYG